MEKNPEMPLVQMDSVMGNQGGKVLLTGGGALNKYLVERMAARAPHCQYVVPDKLTINFKEALIFAFLLRILIISYLKRVTSSLIILLK